MSRAYSRTAAIATAIATVALAGVADPAIAASPSPWQNFTMTRANLAPNGSQALGGHSFFPSISGTGRYVAYRTSAPNAGGPNTLMRDRVTGAVKKVIVRPDGGPSQGSQIIRTSISADGRYVAFCSMAGDLVPGTIPFRAIRVFVRDTQTGTTTLASVDSSGKEFPADSAPAILSGDGRSVAFLSAGQVYVRRLDSATTVKASVAPPGEDWSWGGSWGFPSLSETGRYVAFTRQTASASAVYVRDLVAGTTVLASRTASGTAAAGSEPSLSPGGRYITFVSADANMASGASSGPQIYRRDLTEGKNVRVSTTPYKTGGAGESSDAGISSGGRYVVFASSAPDLVPGDTNNDRDVFVRDIEAGTTTRINVGPAGAQANAKTGWVQPLISADGRSVVFSSIASNLVAGDTNSVEDVFVAEAH